MALEISAYLESVGIEPPPDMPGALMVGFQTIRALKTGAEQRKIFCRRDWDYTLDRSKTIPKGQAVSDYMHLILTEVFSSLDTIWVSVVPPGPQSGSFQIQAEEFLRCYVTHSC